MVRLYQTLVIRCHQNHSSCVWKGLNHIEHNSIHNTKNADYMLWSVVGASTSFGWSLGRSMKRWPRSSLFRHFGDDASPVHAISASKPLAHDLPLIFLHPIVSIHVADQVNRISRSRIAEIQWWGSRGDKNLYKEFDSFPVCKDPKSFVIRHPMRRVALLSRQYPDFDAISSRLQSPETILWIPQWDRSTCDVLEYFLKGYFTPAAVRNLNYELFTKWLAGSHRSFLEPFTDEFLVRAKTRHFLPAEVSRWLRCYHYTDACYQTFASHLLSLIPPLETWSMPPVPRNRRELPLILQDIDGCIKRICCSTEPNYNQFVVELLNQWSRNRTAEVRWMTYWGKRAATEFAPSVGLDTFEHGRDVYVEDPDKEVQVLRWIERNPKRKIVWVDDEIHRYLYLFGKKKDGNRSLVDRLVQHPNLLMKAKEGLSTDDLQTIDTFLAGKMEVDTVLAQNRCVVDQGGENSME